MGSPAGPDTRLRISRRGQLGRGCDHHGGGGCPLLHRRIRGQRRGREPGAPLPVLHLRPFADRDDARMVAAALGFPDDVETLNLSASLRAGTGGLISAARRPSAPTLVVASDARLTRPGSAQELSYGDAAAACLVGPPARMRSLRSSPCAASAEISWTTTAWRASISITRSRSAGYARSRSCRWYRG